jgi:hypothetical protein
MSVVKRRRPRRIDEAMAEQIFHVLRLGGSLQDSADYCRIDRSTLTRQKQRDPNFAQGIKKAVVEGKLVHLQVILTRAKNWQASAWMLERRWPQQFALGPRLQDSRTKASDLVGSLPDLGDVDLPPGAIPPMGPLGGEQRKASEDKPA